MLFLSKKSRKILNTIILLSTVTTGCVPMIAGTGMGIGGYTAIREKGIGESISDTKIESAIKTKLYKISPELYSNVSVSADKGCVLLTGAVLNQSWISDAERESWATEGVIAVDNNIISGQTLGVDKIIQDGVLTSKVRGSLLCAKSVKSVNYKLKTMNSIVYIRGVASSKEELEKVLSIIQHTRGVKKIVSYVILAEKKK